MSKIYDILETGKNYYNSYRADRHQIDQHNNLHLMDEQFEDLLVFKENIWAWFRVEEEKK